MTPHNDKAVVFKCAHCARQSATPPVCDYCRGLNPIPHATDYFTLLGVEQRFDIDAEDLHRKFIALNRHAHPDFHATDSAEVQNLSLQVASTINDAYQTLRDPYRRAGYLLELLGGKPSAEDKSVPDGFLETMMMLQEDLADVKAAGDTAELGRLREVLQNQHDGLMARVADQFDEYQQAVACEGERIEMLDDLRKQLNAVSYVKKLLSQT